ncbi:MAG TPA: choice-of-anchor tandem repeat GloVer-containing protein, partial [Tepidisphaeraceae bacterium]
MRRITRRAKGTSRNRHRDHATDGVQPLEPRQLFAATLTTLLAFDNVGGGNPMGALVIDAAGNLYGTTDAGGALGKGTVFKIAAGSNTPTTLATFNGTNGANPSAGLAADAGGNLYGTTSFGGPTNDGTVFEITAGTHAFTTLANFNFANGSRPLAGVYVDASGNLFGTTNGGGDNYHGTVFELDAATHTITDLYGFDGGANGANPYGRLVADASGNLYGTTGYGGAVGATG